MKRYVLLLGVLLSCFMLKAQSVNYSCRYWFDQDHAQAVTASFSNSTCQTEFDIGLLTEGIHKLHLQVADTSMKWSSPQTYLFFKTADSMQEGLTCHYWFNQDHAQIHQLPFGNGNLLLNVSDLEDGLHTVNILLESENLTTTQNYSFIKVEVVGQDTLDMSNIMYHCWFDQDFEHQQNDYLGDGHILLEVDGLANGLHTVNVMLESSIMSTPVSYMFMKVAVQDPAAAVQYHCWFDNDYSTMQTGSVGSGIFELEVGDLSNGLHTANILVDNGTQSVPQCYLFYKRPVGGYIAKWEYWLNGEINNRYTSNMSPCVDTLSIITLLPVEAQPIRSTCFHFQPNGDEPYINAKNEITLRFWDAESHFIDKTALYVDENVSETIIADNLERNTTVSIDAPRDNQIHWFKLDAGRGDYLSFKADKACSMHLFAPSGEEVFSATGSESILMNGFNVWEDGTYYLAVHDVTGSGETVSVTYNWLNRYAIASYDVHLVGNGGRSTITFQGNGFNSLLDVYLVNVQNDTISRFDIGHESNTTTSVTFDFNGVALGYYKAVFHFIDEDLTVENCILVEEATPFEFDVNVSFASQFLVNTSNKYVYEVHNNSNMTAYDVPLAVCIFTPDAESLTRVDINGFDVESYIINLFDLYTSHDIDSLENVIEQKKLLSGDMFGFVEDYNTNFIPDVPYIHYTFLCPNLRPNTTETFTIEVKSNTMVYVYMWYPEEWENENPAGNLSRNGWFTNDCTEALKLKRMCLENEQVGWNYWNVDCSQLPELENKCNPNPPGGGSVPVSGFDPNDIYGYLSESGSHYMRQEIQNVQYEIEFENDTALATAAAHTIIVRDTLNRSRFDLNSLAARSVTIGDKRLDLNGEQTFARTLDLRPNLNVIAQVNQDYDPTTGIIQWTIQSLDPMTMEPTDDPNQGVLPVNYNGNGVGFIDYSVNLKQAFADGTKIRNRAGIIFDQNDVIMTPIWTNTIDAVKPTSHIEEVEVVNDSLSFSFVSEDNRSGVWYHTLYHRNNSTEMQWQVRKPQVFGNCLMLPIDSLLTTEYLVIAVDSAGNHEEKEMVAEYTYFSSIPITVTQTNTLSRGWNWYSTYIEQEGIDGLGQLENSIGVPKAIIQSQGDGYVKSVLRNGRILWGGALSSINNEEMYKIGTKYICSATMEGVVTNPASHPITINKGWNWIGFPCSQSVSVSEVFSGFTPRNKDVIKGLNSYATYRNGTWIGTLNTLEPGQGYMYGSGSNAPKTLVFQTGRGEATLANITPEGNFYQPVDDFADNMTLTAVIELDGEELRSENYELAAFVDDECRGSVKLMYVEPINRYVAFLTVFGDETEDLYFVLTDGTDMSQSEDFVRYETDGMVGSLGEPVTLRFGTLGVSDGMRLPVHIYPNPSKDVFNIEGVGIRKVEVTNAYGQVILSEEVESDNLQINLSDKAAGAYLLRVVTDRGVATKKLVKE